MIADVALATLGGALALLGIVVVWLVQRNTDLSNQLLSSRDAQSKTAVDLERARFDVAQSKKALDAATKQEQAVTDALARSTPSPGAGLAADDVDGRVRRIEASGGPADQAGRPGAVAAEAVRGAPKPAAADTDLLRPGE